MTGFAGNQWFVKLKVKTSGLAGGFVLRADRDLRTNAALPRFPRAVRRAAIRRLLLFCRRGASGFFVICRKGPRRAAGGKRQSRKSASTRHGYSQLSSSFFSKLFSVSCSSGVRAAYRSCFFSGRLRAAALPSSVSATVAMRRSCSLRVLTI